MFVQILCNKKYSCPKTDSSFSNSDIDLSKPPPPQKKPRQTNIHKKKIKDEPISLEELSNSSIVMDAAKLNHTSTLKKSNFNHNTPSTFQFPPSFNLKSNMKSTPNRPCSKCANTCDQLNSNQITENANINKTQKRKNALDTVIDVHAPTRTNVSDIEIDLSYHSC